jgi:hypothetical protein
MMRVRLRILTCALVALTFPASVWATNGYFSHGTSLAEKGLAGAGVAYSQDTLAAANNPAGMVWQGSRYDIGVAVFSPDRSCFPRTVHTMLRVVQLRAATPSPGNARLASAPRTGTAATISFLSRSSVITGLSTMTAQWAFRFSATVA